MKIKMKNYARHLWLSLLLLVGATAIAVPGLNGTNDSETVEIGTVEQLKAFRDAVNSGTSYAGKTVKLTRDLDLQGEDWIPIGTKTMGSYPGTAFKGVFDGCNHTISNLTVNSSEPEYATAGLFGSIASGTIKTGTTTTTIPSSIKNLTLKNVDITSTHWAGGIVAYASDEAKGSSIENCKVIGGTIKSTPEIVKGSYDNGNQAGGIMGYNASNFTIKNCWVENVTITAYRDIGGIVGCSSGTVTDNTAKNVTVTQDETNGYKNPTPTTIGDIVGRGSATNNVEANGNIVIKSVFVAQIGEKKYESLEAAFAEVKDGETITMLTDVTISDKLVLALEGKSVILNLGENTLNGRTNLTSGNLTIKNGKVAGGSKQALNVYGSATSAENYSVLTIAEDVTVTADVYGVSMFGATAGGDGYGAVVNIAGTVTTTGDNKNGAVFVSGNLGHGIANDMNNVINVTGTITSDTDAAIALVGNATVNVKSGAKITGNTGIAVKRGVLNVEKGATVHATGAENLNPDQNNNGTEMTGAAISMTDTYNNYGAMSVNITGGTFTSDNAAALFKEDGTYTNDATYSVSGGTFSSAVPAEFCAPGYEPKDLGNGQYSVYAPTYKVAIKSVTPKADSWYISGTPNIQFTITKDGEVLSTRQLNQDQLDKWDIILDENRLKLKSKTAAAKWLQYNFDVVGAGTTTIVFQNKANPEIKVEQEVSISHKLILTILPAGTHMVEAGPVEIATNTKFDGVAIENFEDYTFTSSDESIATISGTTITPLKAGTITVTATKNDYQTASASANVTFVDAPAKIGEVYYESIGKAMEAAQSGETITLLRDVTESYSFTGNQPRTNDFALTIDLNGHTWSGSAKPYTLRVDYGTITIKDSQSGGGVKYGSDYAFIVSHLASEYPSKLILENGTFTGKTSVAQVGYPGGSGSNKKYYGGDLVVNGGTFVTVPDEGETYDENGNFKYTLNMLDMAESSYPGGIYSPSTITVNGGKFLKFDPQNNLAEGANTNFVAEGLISTKSVEDGEAWYTISKIVAKIDETTYTSLADAFTAATDGQTITVLTDIDLPSTIAVNKQVTLDLAGKTISNTSDLWAGGNWSFFSVRANGSLTVTGNGTIDAKENDCYTFDVRDGGILTIKNGTFTGNISCVYLTNEAGTGVSTCNIEDGTFSIKQLANNVQDDKYRFLLNCYDAFYKNNTAKFNVTGGSFVNFNPANNQAEGAETNFCAAGYEAVQDGDVWTVQKAPVAKIDNEMYYSLADAFAAATDGETITLLKDVELVDRLFVNAGSTPAYAGTNNRYATTTENKSITLDLNGNNITSGSNIALAGGSLNIVNNGTADATHGVISTSNNGLAPIEIRGTGELTSKRTLTVGENVTLKGAEYGLNIFGSNDTQKNDIEVNVNGKVEGTLFVLGNLKNAENKIVVNVNGSVVSATDAGIALNGNAKVNVAEGASVTGLSGIEVRAGELNVSGGTIKATAEEYSYKANGSGTTTKGAAIAVAQHNTILPATVTVNSGTLEGTKAIAVVDVNNNLLEKITVSAKDELVANNTEIPAGFKWISNEGMSTLTAKEYVAQIGDVKYETLQEAVNAAGTSAATITLLTESATDGVVTGNGVKVQDGQNITFDLNGLTYNVDKTVGSAGTETNGFQLLKGSTVKFTNGTVTSNTAQILLQNYSDLTLDGVTVSAGSADYAVSNNFGSLTVTGETNINAKNGGCAFDLWYGMSSVYDEGIKVTFDEGFTGKVTGKIEYGHANRITDGDWQQKASLEIKAGNFDIDYAEGSMGALDGANIVVSGGSFLHEVPAAYCAEGMVCVNTDDGRYTVMTKEAAGLFDLIDGKTYTRTEDVQAAKVTYTRSFSKDVTDHYQCWYVPFEYTIKDEDAENFQFYKIHMISASGAESGAEVDDNTKVFVHIEKIGAGTVMKANRPYVVVAKKVLTDYVFTAENVTLYGQNTGSRLHLGSAEYYYDFYGTYDNPALKNLEAHTWISLNTSGELFWNKENSSVRSYRWYIKRSANNDNGDYSKQRFIFVEDDEATTGVRTANADSNLEVEGIYTVGGVKVEKPVKGVNIIRYTNGKTKKIYIK